MANTFNLGNGNWAQKTEKLLAYNSENNNYKPLPFNFERSSTATRVNKQGLIETVGADQPRVDYLNNTKGALLLEPSRTNLQTYSSDLSSVYVPTNITQTSNYGASPDGSLTSTRVVLANLTDSRSVETLTGTLTNGVVYTFSCYYKGVKGESTYMYFLSSTGGVSVSKEIIFTGDWQRESITFTAGSVSNYTYVVDVRQGTPTATDFEVWGAQVEQGSYATSYIPTSGSAVTRSAETTSQTVPDGVIGQTEGTLYFEGTLFESPSGSNMQLALSDDTLNNQIKFVVTSATTNIEFSVKDGGSTQVSINETISPNVNNKYAIAYKANDFVMYVNGVQSGSDTSGSVPTVTKISFDREDGNNPIHGEIKNLQLYNTRLSNSELQALTQV